MTNDSRPTLGSFMSTTCFHYLRTVAEETAGRALVISAGRKRGQDVIQELGLSGKAHDAEVIRAKLDEVLGVNGTRLCIVNSVTTMPGGGYEVRIKEGVGTVGITTSEPNCAFTLGVFIGAVSALTGQTMVGKETTCSAMGAPECIYQIEPFA
jgi:predicted hydrocarbon binding protein